MLLCLWMWKMENIIYFIFVLLILSTNAGICFDEKLNGMSEEINFEKYFDKFILNDVLKYIWEIISLWKCSMCVKNNIIDGH